MSSCVCVCVCHSGYLQLTNFSSQAATTNSYTTWKSGSSSSIPRLFLFLLTAWNEASGFILSCVLVICSTVCHRGNITRWARPKTDYACPTHFMEDSKEVEGSLGSRGRTGVHCNERVVAKGRRVSVAVRMGAMVMPAGRIVPVSVWRVCRHKCVCVCVCVCVCGI